jgi:hypothetical protein
MSRATLFPGQPENGKMEETKAAVADVSRMLLIEIFVPSDRTRFHIVPLVSFSCFSAAVFQMSPY